MLMPKPSPEKIARTEPSLPAARRIRDALQAHPLFKTVPPDAINLLATQAHIQTAEKDQILCLQDEDAKFLYIVLSGYIKLFRETTSGAEAILDILGPMRMLGETPLLSTKKHPCSAQAASLVEFIALPYSVIDPLLMTQASFARAMLETITLYRQLQDKEIEHRALQSTSQRIGCFLLHMTTVRTAGRLVIHLPYDKTLIAARLGMQPETFSRGLARLKSDTGLEVHGAKIIIPNAEALNRYCCTACSGNVPCTDRQKECQN